MIIKAKGAILKNQKNDLLIDNFYFPNKLTFGQVLIKIAYSGICGSQIGEIDGVKGIDKFLPHLLGHEGSGVVIDVGDGVTNLKKNDHVVLHWKKNTRIESQNPNYLWKNKKLNAGKITTFNKYAIISENRITKINKNFNLKLASLFGCALTTGFGAVTNTAKVKLGQSIGIFGCGGVGISSVIAASLSGCNPIYTFDISDKKLSFSKKFGANKTINLKKNKKLNLILNLNLDIIIECTGIKENIEMAKSTRREKVKLVSTAGTGFYYTLNKLKGKDKLLLKKYDPKVRKHVDFKEGKLTK